jgi:hypothetical protein
MKKGVLFVAILLVVITAGFAIIQLREVKAQANSFNGIMPFSTASGLIGFFDQRDGKVYLYDGYLKKCILVNQLEELGKPTKVIEKKY